MFLLIFFLITSINIFINGEKFTILQKIKTIFLMTIVIFQKKI